jgi:hypothetical protein
MPAQAQYLAPLPERLNLVPWRDPVVEAVGHGPDSPYVEAVWLGVLGPSTTLAWRRLARLAAARPEALVGTVDLAQSLGLGQGLDKNAPISRAVARMVAFGAADRTGATLAVRTALPDVPLQQRRRLSMSAQLAHEHWGHRQPGPAPAVAGPVSAEVEP